jgi:hypothetical protein
MSSAESSITRSSGNDYVIECSGSAADTTGTNWAGGAGDSLLVRGNRSATNNDGFNDETSAYSTSHYRMEDTTVSQISSSEDNVTFDGLQCLMGTSFTAGYTISGSTNYTQVIRNCRVVGDSYKPFSLASGSSVSGLVQTVENCLNQGDGAGAGGSTFGIYLGSGSFAGTHTYHLYNNTIYGAADGIKSARDDADITINCHNNAVVNCNDDFDILSVNLTLNLTHNASNDGDGTSSKTITTDDDEWTTPGYGDSAIFTPESTGQLVDTGTTGGPSTDLLGDSYGTADIGCFAGAGSGGTTTRFLSLLGTGA